MHGILAANREDLCLKAFRSLAALGKQQLSVHQRLRVGMELELMKVESTTSAEPQEIAQSPLPERRQETIVRGPTAGQRPDEIGPAGCRDREPAADPPTASKRTQLLAWQIVRPGRHV